MFLNQVYRMWRWIKAHVPMYRISLFKRIHRSMNKRSMLSLYRPQRRQIIIIYGKSTVEIKETNICCRHLIQWLTAKCKPTVRHFHWIIPNANDKKKCRQFYINEKVHWMSIKRIEFISFKKWDVDSGHLCSNGIENSLNGHNVWMNWMDKGQSDIVFIYINHWNYSKSSDWEE